MLNGLDLAEFIKERQSKSVRGLIQAHGIVPTLAIIQTKDDPVINTYVRLKKLYGEDIQVEVKEYKIHQRDAKDIITELNKDDRVHGIIVQLPLEDPKETDKICNLVDPQKDVDALGVNSDFDPATPMAIQWLLAGYNIDLKNRKILLIGKGKLVGKPLEKVLLAGGHDVAIADRTTKNLKDLSFQADVLVTATGSPSILRSDMVKNGAVVVDAGVASEDGKTVGDVASDVYERDDVIITPTKGGVGPLTVCALFENVILSARRQVDLLET